MLTLNISGPSVERASRLSAFLLALDLDVLVLTETRANAGTELLLSEFGAAGYELIAPMPASPGERGVAVASRLGFRMVRGGTQGVDLSHRLIVGELNEPTPLRLVAVYVPSRDASPQKIDRKRRFLLQMQDVLQRQPRVEKVILLGDLNVVGRSHEPRYSVFRAWEYEALEAVASHGLVDAFTELHPGVQAHSWIGRTGNGYRYDYAFVSRDLAESILQCEYRHDPRTRGLSDHAGLLLSLSLASRSAGAERSQLAGVAG